MRQQGFSYVVVMFLVAALSLAAVRALENTFIAERRDKEEELLWRGMAYRNAIRDHYLIAPGIEKSYPRDLSDLLDRTGFNKPHRPLRKLYRDPMTEDGQWELLRNESGDLIGVRSRSTLKPLKRRGFPSELVGFDDAQQYQDWRFIYDKNNP